MSKHIPGPWLVAHTKDFRDHGTVVVERFDIHADSDTPVAVIHDWCMGTEADAHIIAAAPDLLEACRKALSESGCDGDLCMHEWHDAARAAIAKATGGAQ